jgi:tetratricopeptide (TPR) repeat protein
VPLFSAAAAALAMVFLFRLLRAWVPVVPALLATALFGMSRSFWDLATVQEMYTLGILMLLFMLNALWVDKNILLFCFLSGLALGVRMDLMLLLPVLLLSVMKGRKPFDFVWMGLCFMAGLSVLLYLLIRSQQNPWVDWGNPETWGTLFNSISRKSYSGTLDLLSLSYRQGENFVSTIIFYSRSFWASFGAAGVLLLGAGLAALSHANRARFWMLSGLFLVSGPLFFFLANMPPNPHALAIMEAAHPVPDLMLCLIMSFGAAWLWKLRVPTPVVAGVLALLVFAQGVLAVQRHNKRDSWTSIDYTTNVLRSAPTDAVLALRKDVQLFSLWHMQLVEKKRADIGLIPVGLSASPWFWDMKRLWPASMTPAVSLKDEQGWNQLLEMNLRRPIFAGYETEPAAGTNRILVPHGLLVGVRPASAEAIDENGVRLLRYFMLDRTRSRYGETPDFFSTDLIGDTARAYQYQGHKLMLAQRSDEALWFFRRAQYLDPHSPQSAADEAYLWFSQNNFTQALRAGTAALRRYEHTLNLTREYKSLPSVVTGIRQDYTNTLVMVGASMEKVAGKPASRPYYARAIEVGGNAQAHYNMAVTYWGEDWEKAYFHMKRAADINPQMSGLTQYLTIAEQRLHEQKGM